MTSTISTHAPTRPPRRPPTPGVRKVPCRPTDRNEPPGSGRVLHPTTISSLDEYRAAGGLAGLQAAAERHPSEIIASILDAGLRGRGGAGFPTGRKWQTVAGQRPSARARRPSSSTAPKASRARSRTAASCAATPTRSSKERSSRPARCTPTG